MADSKTLRLGTRGSDLARTQSTTVADALRAAGHDVELTIIKTAGDRDQTGAFSSIGPQGVFVREIETALVERRIELAVHSFKDLPTTSPAELVIGAVPKRFDPADLLLVRTDKLAGAATRLAAAWRRRARRHRVRAPARLARALPARSRDRAAARQRADSHPQAARRPARRDRARGRGRRAPAGRLEPRRRARRHHGAAARPAALRAGARAGRARRAMPARRRARARRRSPRSITRASHAAVDAERDALRRAEGGCDIAFGAYFVHGDVDAGRRPGAMHELLGMHERAGRVRAARVRGTDPRQARRRPLGEARRRARRRAMTAAATALAGRRILLTRSAEDCAEWAEQIARRGAEAVVAAVHPLRDARHAGAARGAESRARGRGLARVHVAARRRGVRGAARPRRCRRRRASRSVGAATADAARAKLGRVDLVGRGTGAALAAQLAADGDARAAAERADRDRRERRRRARAHARARPARAARGSTSIARSPRRRRRRKRALSSLGAERVVLASPSAASGFVHQVELDAPVAIYTIGPSTTAAARALGLDA